MSDTIMALPPVAELDGVLRTVTERLASEFAYSSNMCPQWNEFEWGVARAAATIHGIAPLLAKQTTWEERPDWNGFLIEQRSHVADRHRRIDRLLEELNFRSRQKGVALLPLKGAALHAIGIYAAGERPMADIDLLVRESDRVTGANLLQDCGFKLSFSNRRHDLFEPLSAPRAVTDRGEYSINPIKIELHSSIRERLPVAEIEITQYLFPLPPRPGLNAYRSNAALMLHLLLHAANNMRAHALRFIQLYDVAKLAERFKPADWSALAGMRDNHLSHWWAAAPLILTSRYFPNSVPEAILRNVLLECPWLLRRIASRYRLADVSFSNIRVYAFPGLEWCRTPTDALRFMASRMLPNHETREEMLRFDLNEGGGAAVPWYGISQCARIARWLFSRPMRVQTLIAVRSALATNPMDTHSIQLPKMSSTD